MAKLFATVIDAADAMVRRLGGQRLCDYCQQWTKHPHAAGGFYFCDKIHASIYFNKQQEAMKQAMEKKRSSEKPPPGRE